MAVAIIAIIALSISLAMAIPLAQSDIVTLGWSWGRKRCGDGICQSTESCSTCPADCLKTGQVCCGGVAYNGNCCSNTDCPSGQVCTNHACIPSNSCSDTDGGWNINVKGTVSGYYNGNSYSYTDFCLNNITLTEHYCSGTQYYSSTANCIGNVTRLCIDGACV